MSNSSQISQIQDILTEVDGLLRERLAAAGIRHVLLAIAPDGAGVVRSNIGPAELEHGGAAGRDRRRVRH